MELIHGIFVFINSFFTKAILIICMFSLLLVSCSDKTNIEQIEGDIVYEQDLSNDTKSEYYRIYRGNTSKDRYNFYYDLLDKEGNIVKTECTYMKEPEIILLDNSIIKVTIQAGTGRDTCGTYYYNIENLMFSPTYYHVLGESKDFVVYFKNDIVYICDMFSKGLYEKEIDLNGEVSDCLEPIKEVFFSDDMENIEITYISGESFSEITKIFEL